MDAKKDYLPRAVLTELAYYLPQYIEPWVKENSLGTITAAGNNVHVYGKRLEDTGIPSVNVVDNALWRMWGIIKPFYQKGILTSEGLGGILDIIRLLPRHIEDALRDCRISGS